MEQPDGTREPTQDVTGYRPRGDSLSKFGPDSAKLRRKLYKASHISAASGPENNPQTSQTSAWHLVYSNRTSNMSRALPPSLAFSASPPQNSGAFPHRLDMLDRERLFTTDTLPARPDEVPGRSKVNFSGRLPGWLWAVLSALLGIGGGKRKARFVIATTLHALTVFSAFLFACCGLFFNVYDIMSSVTTTTVLAGICKSVLGAYWVGIGIYAHSLAARLFSNVRFVDCIRMHSKTVFKINTAAIVVVLSVAAVITNIYWTRGLLEQYEEPLAINTTEKKFKYSNCVTAGVNVALCEVYFIAKIIYSIFNLLWNLLVSTLLLSVCRTHTICIRRFMKELLYDTKIYEEFLMMQAMGPRMTLVEETIDFNDKSRNLTTIMESNIWDDDIREGDGDKAECDDRTSSNARILQRMRSMRQSTFDGGSLNTSFSGTRVFSSSQRMEYSASLPDHDNFPPEHHQDHDDDDDELIMDSSPFPTSNPFHFGAPQSPGATGTATVTINPSVQAKGDASRRRFSSSISGGDQTTHAAHQEGDLTQFDQGQFSSALAADEALYKKALEEGKPPILSNEDLYFTHFQIVRRLSSTSQLLQRWMLTLITFVLMWCGLLIIYWTSRHSVSWPSLMEFIVPLMILYLLSSAYAEVNFEGGRIINSVLPTHERMPVIYYMNTTPLELKVFSMSLTHNAIVTVVAGVAITFATKIILDQVM